MEPLGRSGRDFEGRTRRPAKERPAPEHNDAMRDRDKADCRGRAARLRRGLSIDVTQTGSTAILRVGGALELATFALLDDALSKVDCASLSLLVIDLGGVECLDIAGLTSVIRANERCKGSDTAVTVVKPRGLASRVFTLTRAHRGLDVVAAAPDA
jgi:anti-anti-sigma factor